ncbi:MAG TPA: hypothetical protein VMW24_09100 [Sedimentisphaerales bacterium]|nr:hypothetical protein [Sedimentisphaerales bacterium]
MTKVRPVTQLQLDGFADLLKDAEEGGQDQKPLTMAEVREREMAARQALGDRFLSDDAPSWAEKYHEFMISNIPWRIAAFIAWSIVPKYMRWPKTQDELAVEVLGLTSDRRIVEWRRKYPYIDQMIASQQTAALLDYIPGSIAASGKVASIADYKATPERRLLWEATGIIEKTSKVSIEDPGLVSTGRKMLEKLRKLPTEKKIELLGEEAEAFMQELEEEFAEEDEALDPPTPLSSEDDIPPNSESANLGGEVEA